jgi:hypothetical protein
MDHQKLEAITITVLVGLLTIVTRLLAVCCTFLLLKELIIVFRDGVVTFFVALKIWLYASLIYDFTKRIFFSKDNLTKKPNS